MIVRQQQAEFGTASLADDEISWNVQLLMKFLREFLPV